MIESKFNGIIFEAQEDCPVEDALQAVGKALGSDWTIEKLGHVVPLYIAKPKEEVLASQQAWDHTYQLAKLDSILFAEPDFDQLPDAKRGGLIDCDPHLPGTQYENWARDQIRVPNMDNMKMPFGTSQKWGKGIVIGHTDTGYTRHREVWNDRLLVAKGWDYHRNDNDPFDTKSDHNMFTQFGHGTSTSSLIFSNNEGGYIYGVSKECSIIPIRIDISVIVNMERLIRGLDYALYRGCHITSTSMGNVLGDGFAVDRVLKKCIENGMISFAAGGQAGGWEINILPAKSKYAVGCTASNIYERPWSKAFKSNYITLAAPGESVWVADVKNENDTKNVGRYCGTSFSTALAAGSAALWYAYLSPQELQKRYGKQNIFYAYLKTLQKFGIRRPNGWDTTFYGPGILDVSAHLQGSVSFPTVSEVEEFRATYEESRNVSQLKQTLEIFYQNNEPEAVTALALLLNCDENELESVLGQVGAELRFHFKSNEKLAKDFEQWVNEVKLQANEAENTEKLSELQATLHAKASQKLAAQTKSKNQSANDVSTDFISSLRLISNQSDYPVSYIKLEDRNNFGTVDANTSAQIDVWFPWVANPKEFIEKVLIIEVLGYTRFYIWESNNYIWYVQANHPLEGPFAKGMQLHGNANEFNKGNLVPGKSNKANKEIQIRNHGSTISIEFFDY